MTINPLTSVSSLLMQTGASSVANSSSTSSSNVLPLDTDPQLSPAARFMAKLQELAQQDPARFKQLTAAMATQFQNAAKAATANGDTTQAGNLNNLAKEFQTASQTGAVPQIQASQQESGATGQYSGHHHRGHHPHGSSSTDSSTDPLSALLGSTSANSSSSTQSLLTSLFAPQSS